MTHVLVLQDGFHLTFEHITLFQASFQVDSTLSHFFYDPKIFPRIGRFAMVFGRIAMFFGRIAMWNKKNEYIFVP